MAVIKEYEYINSGCTTTSTDINSGWIIHGHAKYLGDQLEIQLKIPNTYSI